MLEWSVWGVQCRLSLCFPAAVIAMLTFDTAGLVLPCLLASFIHECGHFLMMLAVKDKPARIHVGLFGVRVERRSDCRVSYIAAAVVSLGGPLMNILCFFLFWKCGDWQTALVHVTLGGFNLLPVYSLDGGEALYSVLCRWVSEQTAERVGLGLSVITVFPLTVLGVWLFLNADYNFTLLFLCGYLILLLFLKEKH